LPAPAELAVVVPLLALVLLDFDDEPQPPFANTMQASATTAPVKRVARSAIVFLSVMIQIGTAA
jgi:hypothetical protein